VAAGDYRTLKNGDIVDLPSLTVAEGTTVPALTVALSAVQAGGRNYVTYTGDRPAALEPGPLGTPTIVAYKLGTVWGPGKLLVSLDGPYGDTSAEVVSTVFTSDFTGLANLAVPPNTMLNNIWDTTNVTLTYDKPNNRLVHTMTSVTRRAWTYVPAGTFTDGVVKVTATLSGGNVTKQIRALLMAGGTGDANSANNHQQGWVAQLAENGLLSLYPYLDGVVPTPATFQTPITALDFSGAVQYVVEISSDKESGTNKRRIQARAYVSGAVPPAWQLTDTTERLNVAGYGAFAFQGTSDGGKSYLNEIQVTKVS
jgi:hypothetical protein